MADQQAPLDQEEIERLLGQPSAPPSAKEGSTPTPPNPPTGSISADQIEAMLSQGASGPQSEPNRATASASSTVSAKPMPAAPVSSGPAQDTVDRTSKQAGKAAAPLGWPVGRDKGACSPLAAEAEPAPEDLEFLLNQAERALASIDAGHGGEPPPGVSAFRLEEFTGAPASTDSATLNLIRDVELDIRIELGRTHMYLEDLLKLRSGSVVPLDKLAGDPVDIFVNERLIARGEVLVLNDNFCVRVAELIMGTTTAAN